NIVIMSHDDGIETYYASLTETKVQEGDEVKQGDILGIAGKNVFSADSGVHVHFEIHKDGVEVNPEEYLDEPFQNLVEASLEEIPSESDLSESEGNDDENTSETEDGEEEEKEWDEVDTDPDEEKEDN